MLRWLALALVLPAAALAQVNTNTYLIFPDQASAMARAQAQCTALGCDGTFTKYWWAIIGPLSAGTIGSTPVLAGSYVIEIRNSGPFAKNTTVGPHVTQGLTATEQLALVTFLQVSPLLPVVVP